MAFLLIFLGAVAVQGCQTIPENSERNNILVHSFDAEASHMSLEDLSVLLNTTADKYLLHKIMNSTQIDSISSLPINATGFCGIDKQLDLVLITMRTNQSVKAVFYGCNLHFKRNVKIFLIEKGAQDKKFNQFMSEKNNWEYNSSFCKCSEDFNRAQNCTDTSESNVTLAMLIITVYVVVFLTLCYACRISNRIGTSG